MEELLSTWKKEALATLGVRHKGTDIEMYKVVAERRVGITSRLVLAILPKTMCQNPPQWAQVLLLNVFQTLAANVV